DALVFEELDETFDVHVFKSKSKEFIIIGSSQTMANEYRYLPADDPLGDFKLLIPRERGHEFSLDHMGGKFYMRTNWDATNFRIMSTDEDKTDRGSWQELVAHSDQVFIGEFELFKGYIAIEARSEGLAQVLIQPLNGTAAKYIDFGEPAYDASIDDNYEADTEILRYSYESMTTPESIIDYNMSTDEQTLLKEEEVLGGFDKSNYVTERLVAPAKDGTLIPISIVYRKGLKKNGSAPCLLYGYGSYGYNIDPDFKSSRISLLDRGFSCAIAHVRGSQTMGRAWYEDGRLLKKKNTFTDFIACAEYLIDSKTTSADRLFAEGGSAGGLLVGAVANMAPNLFHGIIAEVPWVDVVTTMLDADIPLTTSEYDEWGNPEQREYYDYMLSYSPYDQVVRQAYPNMLITTGLEDSQVQYWEPAKWTAKLRANKTDKNRLLFKIEMAAGHGGPSGRFKRYHETAFQYAFMLDLMGIGD
ncbi:S9 family peptidase, partial [Candidatus Neomarinimicrobiota bacterium]